MFRLACFSLCFSSLGFNVSFNNDWVSRELPASGAVAADKVSDKVKSFFKLMKSINDDRRAFLSRVYAQNVRSNILDFCVRCMRQNKSSAGALLVSSPVDATSETFSFDLRKEVALQEFICAVVDLDEMLPANFMKSHFNAL